MCLAHHTCQLDRPDRRPVRSEREWPHKAAAGPSRPLRHHVLPAPVYLETEAMSVFHHALSVWAQQREFRAVYAELARHTDRELRDMGIDRSDITRIAYDEAERRIVTPAASSTPATGGLQSLPVARRIGFRLPPNSARPTRAAGAVVPRAPERNLPC